MKAEFRDACNPQCFGPDCALRSPPDSAASQLCGVRIFAELEVRLGDSRNESGPNARSRITVHHSSCKRSGALEFPPAFFVPFFFVVIPVALINGSKHVVVDVV